ncbi:uncharacterized protein LOC144300243 [Canis aureus]
MLQGRGALICTAWGYPAAGPSSLSCALPTSACPGERRIRSCVCPAPWDPGPVDPRSQGPPLRKNGGQPPLAVSSLWGWICRCSGCFESYPDSLSTWMPHVLFPWSVCLLTWSCSGFLLGRRILFCNALPSGILEENRI